VNGAVGTATEALRAALGRAGSGSQTYLAPRVLAELEAAGFVVVQLPEPTGEYDTGLEFSDGSVAGTVMAGGGTVHHSGWEWTPEQARDVAASWLAAAAVAESAGTA
jgi:hypothetical protein